MLFHTVASYFIKVAYELAYNFFELKDVCHNCLLTQYPCGFS